MIDKPFYLSKDLERTKEFELLESNMREDLLNFREQGYLVLDLNLGDDFLDKIIADCLKEFDKVEYQGSGRPRIQNAFTFSSHVKSLALNEKVLEFIKVAFGRKPIPFQTLNFERGSEQATHSDAIHFNSFPYGYMCGVWVALEDVDSDNGPLHYYPGSHKLPFFGLDQFSLHGSSDQDRPTYELYPQYEEGVQQLIASLKLEKESLTMKKGQCLIWAANLLHGGDPIRDERRTRYSQVTHYFFEDCFYYTPLLSSPFHNDFFVRTPLNIAKGKMLDEETVRDYALKVGIDITKFSVRNKKNASLFKRIFS